MITAEDFEPQNLPRLLWRLFSSYGLATAVLVLMTLVTLFGTLYQIEYGLYAAKAKYFHSLWLVHRLGDGMPFVPAWLKGFPIPLPGGMLLMGLLVVNLVIGAILKVKKRWRGAGMLIAHLGMIYLMVSGYVTYALGTDGYMALYEGQSSNRVESYRDYQFEILPLDGEGRAAAALVIPTEQLAVLGRGGERVFQSDQLPFDVALSGYEPNAIPMPVGAPMAARAKGEEIDGFRLLGMDESTSDDMPNQPGFYATFRPKKGDAGAVKAIFSARGGNTEPGEEPPAFGFEMDGGKWAARYVKKTWLVPYTVRLDKFIFERHPGVSMARNYESRITRIDGKGREKAVEIRMNEPMRNGGFTFFQESFGPQGAGPGDRMYSQFAVANNPADQWPLYALVVTFVGLMVHFGISLVSFLERASSAKSSDPPPVPAVATTPRAKSRYFRILVAFATLCAGSASAKDVEVSLESYAPWPKETVDTFRELMIQEGGRVKPVNTHARFTLLQFSGKSSAKFKTADGEAHKIDAAAWLLDVLFRPELAREMPIFVVDDSEAVAQVEIEMEGRRDRYSYADLVPGRAKLAQLTADYAKKQQLFDESDENEEYRLDRVEAMVLRLGRNVSGFEYLLGQFGFARKGEGLVNEELLPQELKDLDAKLDIVELLEKMPEWSIDQLIRALQQPSGDDESARLVQASQQLFFFHANSGRGIALFPPTEEKKEEWLAIGDVMLAGLASKADRPWAVGQMKRVRALVDAAKGDAAGFGGALKTFADTQRAEAEARGEGAHTGLEVKLYQGKYFTNALAWFILAFVLLALSWLAPGSTFAKWMKWAVVACLVLGVAYDSVGIAMRCVIRHRPPITNLYDTVIFITAVVVLLALILEAISRIGVGLFIGALAGAAGMLLSIRYEASEASDTMGQLVAVLDTNFWLATHVIIINIGYAAGMLACLLSCVYLVGRFFVVIQGDSGGGDDSREYYRTLSRMTYGIVCFCLLFSLVGTVLGGIWANYSWGRFWGWDPKENGALMICLWTLVILHARMGGYIREVGLNVLSVMLGIIVTFSWWGVNNLGVGLHSYGGLTGAVWKWLFVSWGLFGLIMLCGIPLRAMDNAKKAERKGKKGGSEAAAA
ncbi:MAG: cytochrome c biogenesis protein CcsA [Verrucomicrobiae bacterium]|nr:cytochrome c biogenesis protein CcsA [Verrucomicrobiae bacterium]